MMAMTLNPTAFTNSFIESRRRLFIEGLWSVRSRDLCHLKQILNPAIQHRHDLGCEVQG
jgi:hypothetical protein